MAYTNTQDKMKYMNHYAVPNTSRPINFPLYDLSKDLRVYNKTYRPLLKASFTGDWEAAKVILDEQPILVQYSITPNKDTLLHLAASAESSKLTEEFLENLVNMMEISDLGLENSESWNALHVAAANGSIKMAETMLKKNQALISIRDDKDYFPLTLSAFFGHQDLTRYLYSVTEGKIPTYMEPRDLWHFVEQCVRDEMFDITLRMLEDFPYKFVDRTYAVILDELAQKPNLLNRPEQNIILKNIDQIFVKLHMKNGPSEYDPPALKLLKTVLNICTQFTLGQQYDILKGPYEPVLDSSGTNQNIYKYPSGLLFAAVEMGNTAFLLELVQVYLHLLTKRNVNNDTIFHVAIEHRHRGIYNLLYEIGKRRLLATTCTNNEGNTMLHVLAKSSKEIRVQTTSGASLLMQRELLWFQYSDKTLGFAVAFTVPGGYNQESGFPIFLHERSFLVFVIADAISLFSASTSLLVFLSILTSRYGPRDFLHSLPRKLMIGLLTLFISVLSMMVTFAASFFVLYHNGLKWVPLIISISSAIPVTLFGVLQLPVWLDMFRSTFDSRYLFNPQRRMIYMYNNSMV